MLTLTHKEALESLTAPITLGEKHLMLSDDEFNTLFAEFNEGYEIDVVHVYSDRTENKMALRKFMRNACYNSMTTINTNNVAVPELEYGVLAKPILGDLRVGIKDGSSYTDGATIAKEGIHARVPVFDKNRLHVVRVLRTTKSATNIISNKFELHVFIPRLRMTNFDQPKTYAPVSLKESEIK